MSIANKISEIFGAHLGDQEDLKAKVAGYIHDKVLTFEGDITAATPPDNPVPWGIYKSTGAGTLNSAALTVAEGSIVVYDPDDAVYLLITTTADNS